MEKANAANDEASRLEALRQLEIMDTEPESDLDEIVQLASSLCNTPISLITLLDDHRQWFKAKTGLNVQETHRDFAFCAHAIHQDDIMEVEDATRDARFVANPLVTGDPSIRFYAGMPLVTNAGFKLGTLCVIDRKPKLLTHDQKVALRTLAKQVIKQFELRLKVKELNLALGIVNQQQQKLKKYNETSSRLLSIIGHDLRGPMTSLAGILKLFSEDSISKNELMTLTSQLQSVIHSGEDLLDNLLVWGTAQLKGEDVAFTFVALRGLLDSIALQNEPFFQRKKNIIHVEVPSELIIQTDKNIIEFVVRNLLLNANKFSTNSTILVETQIIKQNQLTISIIDQGVGIEASRLASLFSWEKRRSTAGTAGESGSGIGLKLSAELIEKLGGTLTATSVVGQGSTFIITLPMQQKDLRQSSTNQ